MKKTGLIFILCLVFTNTKLLANVDLPAIFSDHMVLQRNSEVTIWGWAKSGEPIKLYTSWSADTLKTKADPNANWQLKLKTPDAGGPYKIIIEGYNRVEFNDVLIGEVWLCSGQSNMEWSARMGINNAEHEIAAADHPNIRFFNVAHRTADTPQNDLGGKWQESNPETMQDFSAVAYFFGRKLNHELDVPIGLINSSWGGTPAEVWVNKEVITSNPVLNADAPNIKEVPWCPVKPGKAYNTMIAPFNDFRIAGALWYQGETNTYSPDNYAVLLPALIESWRNDRGYDFPFYFVQIAPFPYGDNFAGVRLRDAQRKSLKVPNTGMIVVSDIGDIEDIHPRNKQDVGLRLANMALNKHYGKKDIVPSGPLYERMEKEGNRIRIFFKYAEKGLACKGKELTHFEIACEDGDFVKANAKIDGNSIVVQAKNIKEPVAVRFAWSDTAEPNLFNSDGLPASCFITEN